MIFVDKNDIILGLIWWHDNLFVMNDRQSFGHIWIFKINSFWWLSGFRLRASQQELDPLVPFFGTIDQNWKFQSLLYATIFLKIKRLSRLPKI